MAEAHLLTEVRDGIGTMILNRPAALNALSDEMVEAMIHWCGRFEADPAVRCVVLKGAGEHFLSGGDIKEFRRQLLEERDAHLGGIERRVVDGHLAIARMRRMGKPVLAVLQGAVAGYGIGLMAAADLAIAADTAFFTMAYRHIGLSSDAGATYFLPRLIGERRALELALLGDRFDAARALDLGLVNWVVPRDELDAEADRLARRLADGPTAALGEAKRLLRTSLDTTWDVQSAAEAESIARLMATDDHLEGLTAVVERRPPHFSGR